MAEHTLFSNFNPVDATPTYSYYDTPVNAPKYLKTSGSDTTVSELNTGDDTFQGFVVGDLIHVRVDGTVTTRRVTDVTGAPDSVDINAAVDWENGGSGRAFSYQRIHSGTTAATDGWFYVGDAEDKSVLIIPTTIASTSIEYVINGDIAGNSVELYSGSILAAAAGTNVHIPIVENVRRLQVGISSTGEDADAVSVVFRAKPKEARP